MGFGDKLKDLRKQAQDAVAEHSDQIHNALDAAGVAANAKTGGKHTQRITKFGEKASGALDKFAAEGEGGDAADAPAAAPAAAAPGAAAPESSEAAGPRAPEAAAPDAPAAAVPQSPPEPPAAPKAPPAPNPDLAAWAAGEDSAADK
jgi:hypothetical protein